MDKSEKGKIAAVVVTFNRKELLGRCLGSLLAQSERIDSIIVIDNASTDGTPEFLRDKGYLIGKAIDYVRMSENVGGAGGFYEGMKRGFERGFEWIWLMDDDAAADEKCLEYLVSGARTSESMVMLPLVIDEKSKNLLAFNVCRKDSGDLFKSVGQAQSCGNVFETSMASFNGILINRVVVGKIGFPRKEFFIWGDDVEYSLRIIKNNFKVCVVPKGRFYHPMFMNRYKKILGGFLGEILVGNELYFYCRQRNSAVIAREYEGSLSACRLMAKDMAKLLFYSFQENNFRFFKLSFLAFYHAVNKKFGGERKFLKNKL